ncbi:MAG: response regulator [Candidatus Latescibacteria bacterium]|nr:response regulator [Candidatus Latescibacterota bacterium]
MPAVLIVDDNIPVLELLEKVLALASYDVFKASGGKQALDVFRRESIDVVITDIAMPGMGGVEFLTLFTYHSQLMPPENLGRKLSGLKYRRQLHQRIRLSKRRFLR